MVADNKIGVSFYDELHKREWKHLFEFGPSVKSRFRLVLNQFIKFNFKKSNVLEVGCSTGGLLTYLKNELNLTNYYASDFSKESVSLAINNGITNAFQADLTRIEDFRGLKFDSILCSEVLEHIPDYKTAIKNLSTMLNKGGKIMIVVPYSMKYWTQHDTFSGHVRRFEAGEIEEELKANHVCILKSFVWGAFFYNIYYYIIECIDPKKLMGTTRPSFVKKQISKFLYYLFYLDDYLLFLKNGRKLYIIGEKVNE